MLYEVITDPGPPASELKEGWKKDLCDSHSRCSSYPIKKASPFARRQHCPQTFFSPFENRYMFISTQFIKSKPRTVLCIHIVYKYEDFSHHLVELFGYFVSHTHLLKHTRKLV